MADITFSLWYQLSECLYDNETELWEQFRPHVQELLAALCNHCKLDEKLPPVSYHIILQCTVYVKTFEEETFVVQVENDHSQKNISDRS